MKINSEITPDTRFVQLNTGIVQQLIRSNKVTIRELDTEKKYLQHIINLYWNSSNPLNSGILSSAAFSCLNSAKDELRAIKKKLKLLSSVQYSLKCSIR